MCAFQFVDALVARLPVFLLSSFMKVEFRYEAPLSLIRLLSSCFSVFNSSGSQAIVAYGRGTKYLITISCCAACTLPIWVGSC